MSARDEVLARIRAALGDDPPVLAPAIRDYRTADDLPPGDPALLDLLTDRLVDYKATVVRCGPSEVAGAVAAALPAGDVVVAPGLPADWRPDGAVEDDGRPAVELADFAAAVTGVAVAVAETGTLFLDGPPTSGRRALSPLPDCPVCVVTVDQVVGGAHRTDPGRPGRELERVEGVHGPRTLIVVLVG